MRVLKFVSSYFTLASAINLQGKDGAEVAGEDVNTKTKEQEVQAQLSSFDPIQRLPQEDRALAEKLFADHHLPKMEKSGDSCYKCSVCVRFARSICANVVKSMTDDEKQKHGFDFLVAKYETLYEESCEKWNEFLK